MRAMPKLGGALALVVLLTGCVLSVDPVVPESEATFDPRLLGAWEEVSGSDYAVITRAAQNTYSIHYRSGAEAGAFEARLGRLGGRLVLDAWPTPGEKDLPEPYSGVLIPGHVLVALDVSSDEVRVSTLDPDAMLRALRAGDVRMAYSSADDRLVLQAATPQLRSELRTYIARPGALGKADVWRRAAVRPVPAEVPCFEASAWREADALFHRDPHWVGADVASSVDLGGVRTLWLFGDTWIDPTGKATRQGAIMVSNSVAIQTGANPVQSRIEFYWGKAADGKPAALVPDRGEERLWFGNGVRVGDRLVLFFSRTIRVTTGLGFDSVGWTAVMVENPDAEPPAWRVRPLETPANTLGILVGFAAVIRQGDYVYALGSQNPVKSHPIYAARWPAEKVRRGELLEPEWWAGDRLGWVPDSAGTPRWPLFENGQAELTVHPDGATGRFLAVHTQGFGPADVTMRAAPALTGPWTEPRMMYRPPEYYRPRVMVYAGKAHPHLSGADLVLTYATNTFDPGELARDDAIYYPRFVRLTRCK